MRFFRYLILCSVLCGHYACRKKNPDTFVLVDQENHDRPYARLFVYGTGSYIKDSLIGSGAKMSMSFLKDPEGALPYYPELSDIQSFPLEMVYFKNTGSLDDRGSSEESDVSGLVKQFKISFTSLETGDFFYEEKDTIIPSCSWNKTDTILISRKSMTTFTLTNYPASFNLAFTLKSSFKSIEKPLHSGINTVKIYPGEVQTLDSEDVTVETVFSQVKNIYVNDKRYQYERRFVKAYSAKITD